MRRDARAAGRRTWPSRQPDALRRRLPVELGRHPAQQGLRPHQGRQAPPPGHRSRPGDGRRRSRHLSEPPRTPERAAGDQGSARRWLRPQLPAGPPRTRPIAVDPSAVRCQNGARTRPGCRHLAGRMLDQPGPINPCHAVRYLFTSESVSEGHPDKVCDRISDTIVDAYLAAMPEARVACETLATTNRVVIAGEVRGPDVDARPDRRTSPARRSATSATSRTASTGQGARSTFSCTPSRPTSPRASTPPATRTRAPATRASCSAMPAARRRS